MRWVLGLIAVVSSVSRAEADQKIKDFIPGLEREATACTTQVGGMLKVATGADRLAKAATDAADKADLEKAATALAKGHAAVAEYCTELGAFVKFLKDNEGAAYKSVEKEIDTRHTKVGALRREAKRIVEELGPLTRKLIPRITRLPAPEPDREKKTSARFPSGRAIELPVLGGTWKLSGSANSDVAEYTDKKKVTATITTRAAEGDCAAQRKVVAKDADQLAELAKSGDVVFAISYTRRETSGTHAMIALCAPSGAHSMLAIADITDASAAAALSPAITKLAFAMLAARR